jgi:CheY-like chemotaxis protein
MSTVLIVDDDAALRKALATALSDLGCTYTAQSRHGPANQLARQLVAAGLPDRPMVIRYRGLAGTMTYRSFHAAATWTFSEVLDPHVPVNPDRSAR